jgi:hypothetical protein
MSSVPGISRVSALQYARIGRAGIAREWPHSFQHLAHNAAEVRTPQELHPAFFGCYDWHSAVHTHWMLARLRRLFPKLPVARAIEAALDRHLTAANIAVELAYFQVPGRGTFERPYGWGWLLALAAEVRANGDAASQRWAAALQPLEKYLAGAVMDWLPRLSQPVRTGMHGNTAFSLAMMLDYARAVKDRQLEQIITSRSRSWFGADTLVPASWEPGGADFISPALAEADLMRRVLPWAEFEVWWHQFLPVLPETLLNPARPQDRNDAQFVHLDGLNLSRAWMLRGIASSLSRTAPARVDLLAAAQRHAAVGLGRVASGSYLGEHWLATFAVRLLT